MPNKINLKYEYQDCLTPEPAVFILPCAVSRGTAMCAMFIPLFFSFPLAAALWGQKMKARGSVEVRKHEFSFLALWSLYLLVKKIKLN